MDKDIFRKIACDYERKFIANLQIAYDELKSYLIEFVRSKQKVLDIGAGKAIISRFLAKKGIFPFVVGMDTELTSLCLGEELAAKLNAKFIPVLADGLQIPIRDNAVSTVTCNGALHHLVRGGARKLKEFFSEIKRILRASGIVIIGDYYYPTTNKKEIENTRKELRRLFGHAAPAAHFTHPEEVVDAAAGFGMSLIKVVKNVYLSQGVLRYYIIALRKS